MAAQYAQNSAAAGKGSTILSYRGAVAHYNGVECERAIMMLEAICGNIERPGGRFKAVRPSWKYPQAVKKNGSGVRLDILDGSVSDNLLMPTHHANHRVLEAIAEGTHGRPDVYMTYCHNPVYANGDCQRNMDILKDRSLIPYFVAVDTAYSETSSLADMVLPDATYLERWDWEDMVSMNGTKEFCIRQPVVNPLGDAKDFRDVCVGLGTRLRFLDADTGHRVSIHAGMGDWTSAKDFVRHSCNHTREVQEEGVRRGYADGFAFMRDTGAYTFGWNLGDDGRPAHQSIFDQLWDPGDAVLGADGAYRDADGKAVAHEVGGQPRKGFQHDGVTRDTVLFTIDSKLLRDAGMPGKPTWMPVPEHRNLGDNLVMTTFKHTSQTNSRTQNCKYLSEIYHDNPAWMNPDTAWGLGIQDGDTIRITTANAAAGGHDTTRKYIITKAKVTEHVTPGVVAISHHCGRWEGGRYATANTKPNPLAGTGDHAALEQGDPDISGIPWAGELLETPSEGPARHGVHPNWITPNAPDPVSGQLRFMDTVVSVSKV